MMRILRALKLAQYKVRQWAWSTVSYPKTKLSVSALSYDDYWDTKRPRENKVALSPAESDRAKIISHSIVDDDVVTIGDIGSGPGVVLKAILDMHPRARGIAFDSSARALEEARALGLNGELLDLTMRGAIDTIQTCDYYLLLEVLEHIPNSEEILIALTKKAIRGVFFSVPNTGFITYRLRLLFGKVPAQWIHMPNEHLRFWTVRDMRWWLKALGFRKTTITPYRGIPILNTLWPTLFAEGMVVCISKLST